MKDRREYEADVAYEVWRRGGNPDSIDQDAVDEEFYRESPVDESAEAELRRQRN